MRNKEQQTPTFFMSEYHPSGTYKAVIYLIASFKTKAWHYRAVVSLMQKMGIKVVVIDYLWKPLLEVYPEEWVSFSDRINEAIADSIQNERVTQADRKFGIIGVSVGSILALHAAKELPELKRVLLVTMYGSSARHVWEHPSLIKMRTKLIQLGLDEAKAYSVFDDLEPTAIVPQLLDKEILLFASKHDPVIAYSNTELFINAAKTAGVKLIVETVASSRHSVAIVKAFQRKKSWQSFLLPLVK